MRPCIKCYATDRYINGKCRPCQNARSSRWYTNNAEKTKSRAANWNKNNPNYIRDYRRKYENNLYKTDIQFKLAKIQRNRLHWALKDDYKSGSAVQDLGCSIEKLKLHLEKQFQPGMAWENQGQWHIDHIIPLSKFDLTDRGQLLKACHFTNLQPLWAKNNLSKGGK